MRKSNNVLLFICGLLLTLAAFPVSAQENQVRDVEINQKPFQDLVELVREKVDKKEVDLTKPFLVKAEGILDKSGRIDLKTVKFVKTEGNAEMVETAKSFIEAVNASGSFGYLKNIGVDKISLMLAQDNDQVYAGIVSEQKTPEKAKISANFFDTVFSMLLFVDERGLRKLTSDERILFNGIKVNSENNNIILNFTYQKSIIQEMINHKLRENDKK